MLRRTIIFKIIILSVFASSFVYGVSKITEPNVNKFIDRMVTKHKFERTELETLLLKAEYQEDIIKAMKKPAEKLPWHRYEKIFLKDSRIQAGAKFWKENEATLNRASKVYGVPPEIIVSLIGVETFYGKHKGTYRVLDALTTLAFHYPPRSKFFTSELEQFLLYTKEEKADPRSFYGSYAGAMGYPQFIASSIRGYAVDFTNDGRRDLHDNIDDAIGSVANYIKKHGWIENQPITNKASITGNKYKELGKKLNALKPKLTLKELKNYDITTTQAYNPKLANKLSTSILSFDLEKSSGKPDNTDYWLAFNNFYVITRYNHSQNYALAVYLLSEKIREEYKPGSKKEWLEQDISLSSNAETNNGNNNTAEKSWYIKTLYQKFVDYLSSYFY